MSGAQLELCPRAAAHQAGLHEAPRGLREGAGEGVSPVQPLLVRLLPADQHPPLWLRPSVLLGPRVSLRQSLPRDLLWGAA